jgi:dethiobiotin synthetase
MNNKNTTTVIISSKKQIIMASKVSKKLNIQKGSRLLVELAGSVLFPLNLKERSLEDLTKQGKIAYLKRKYIQ